MVTITVTSTKRLFVTTIKLRIESETGYLVYTGRPADVKNFLSPIIADLVIKEIPYKLEGTLKIL